MAERISKTEIIVSGEETLERFAALATHEDRAVRLLAEIFANRVDLGALLLDEDPKSGEFLISGRVIKDCDPPIWMGLKYKPNNSFDADALLLIDHKRLNVGSWANFELIVHGRQEAEGNLQRARYPFIKQPESLHVTSEWIEGALMVLSGISREVRLGLSGQATKQS